MLILSIMFSQIVENVSAYIIEIYNDIPPNAREALVKIISNVKDYQHVRNEFSCGTTPIMLDFQSMVLLEEARKAGINFIINVLDENKKSLYIISGNDVRW